MSEREPTISEDLAEVATVLLFARDGQEPFARIQAHVEALEGALGRIARMDTGITADALLSAAPSIARAALAGESDRV